jgi:hypothetical protein
MGQVAYIKVAKVRAVQVAIKLDRQYLGAHDKSSLTRPDLSPKRPTRTQHVARHAPNVHMVRMFSQSEVWGPPDVCSIRVSVDGHPRPRPTAHQVLATLVEWWWGTLVI